MNKSATSHRRDGNFWSFLSRLLSRPTHTGDEVTDTARRGAVTPNRIPDHASADDIRRSLAELLDDDQSAPGAHIRVIGLRALKQKVGSEWPKFHRFIHMAVENVLAKALSKTDRYIRIGDDLYIIAYAGTDAENASRRTDAIAEAFLKHLLGTQADTSISVQAVSGRIRISDDGGLHFAPAHAPESAHVSAETTAGDIDWRDPPKTTTGTSTSPKNHMEQALEKAKQAARRLSNAKVQLGYAPIWDTKKNIVSSYAVLPYRAVNSGYIYEHRALGIIPSKEAQLALDIRCLRRGITDLAELYSRNERSLICVQIKYDSLLSTVGMRDILKESSQVPEFLRKYLAAVIVGVPADVQLAASSRIIAMLRPYFRFVVLRAPSIKSQIDDLARMGMDVVAVPLPEKEGLSTEVRARIERLVSQSVAHKIALTVEYVPTVAVAAELQALGVPYLSGRFIGPLLQSPVGIQARDLSDFPPVAS